MIEQDIAGKAEAFKLNVIELGRAKARNDRHRIESLEAATFMSLKILLNALGYLVEEIK